jgi:murein DD-endopeptidase MepM/ murein hydrolase activator NlpD
MSRNTLLWIGIGSGVFLLLGRKQSAPLFGRQLQSPIAGNPSPQVTPHGYFGAHRAGPPVHDHQGLDLVAKPGSQVLAVGDGVIVATDPGLGKLVRKLKLDPPSSWRLGSRRVAAIVYADLGTPLVKPGDRVRIGDPVATVDKTGFFHFAVKEQRGGSEIFFDPREAGFAYRTSGPAVA